MHGRVSDSSAGFRSDDLSGDNGNEGEEERMIRVHLGSGPVAGDVSNRYLMIPVNHREQFREGGNWVGIRVRRKG